VETRRPSRLPSPACGVFLYRSSQEDPGQLVAVTFEEGQQVAQVVDGEDAGEVLLVAEMGGAFERAR
jgi:hypothetical protein